MNKTPYIKFKNIYVIPTFHSRIEFARLVRRAYFNVFPDVIAVELPDNIRDEVIEGIEVADTIVNLERNENDCPLQEVKMIHVTTE